MDYKLSPRQLEALWSIAEYGSAAGAAQAMGISEQTVKNHLSEAIRKTGSKSSVQAYHRLYQGRMLRVKTVVEYEELP